MLRESFKTSQVNHSSALTIGHVHSDTASRLQKAQADVCRSVRVLLFRIL